MPTPAIGLIGPGLFLVFMTLPLVKCIEEQRRPPTEDVVVEDGWPKNEEYN